MPQSATPPKKRRSELVRLAIVLAIGAAVVIGFFLLREIFPGDIGSLQIGDCIDVPAENDSITQVQHRRCVEPHDAEVFFLLTDPAGSTESYPIIGNHFIELAATQCLPAATRYMGVDFETRQDLDVGIFYPTLSSWNSGDRGVTCYLYKIDKSKLAAPLKAAGASS
jgi:hypothetical protein